MNHPLTPCARPHCTCLCLNFTLPFSPFRLLCTIFQVVHAITFYNLVRNEHILIG